ncbi:MAG: 5'/3'-nucleotidase SurE [Candidatus Latescibacteria bacterium]|nr:5'/3'-nucleotidase SurE [Candidatus Latescibacterota bacterium]
MNILLTNDDGQHSPLLPLALEGVGELGAVTTVVPARERSGAGKSITCFERLVAEPLALGQGPAYTVSGTPADCANIGIHHLCRQKPDLVVSGINIGINAGIGFLFASGTVGACLEGNIAGIPGIALSQEIPRPVMDRYFGGTDLPAAIAAHLRRQTQQALKRVFAILLECEDFWHSPVTWNVNIPYEMAADWDVCRTRSSLSVYGSWFKRQGDAFVHELDGVVEDTREDSDTSALQRGQVSMARLDIRSLGQELD